MTTRLMLLAALAWAFCVSSGLSFWSTARAGDDPTHVNETIQKLRQERVKVLEDVVKFVREEYDRGTVTSTALNQAQLSLLEARLEMSKAKEERVAICEQHVKTAEAVMKDAVARVNVGAVPSKELFAAQADWLAARIRLEQVKLEK